MILPIIDNRSDVLPIKRYDDSERVDTRTHGVGLIPGIYWYCTIYICEGCATYNFGMVLPVVSQIYRYPETHRLIMHVKFPRGYS